MKRLEPSPDLLLSLVASERRPRPTATYAALCALGLALLIAGCGGSELSQGPRADSGATADGDALPDGVAPDADSASGLPDARLDDSVRFDGVDGRFDGDRGETATLADADAEAQDGNGAAETDTAGDVPFDTSALPCPVGPPRPEACDGRDNDCDGDTDEGLLVPACVSQNEFGTCSGVALCAGAAGWACNAPEPRAEACDGADNDCDGDTDEDFPELGAACDDPADADFCAGGRWECDPGSGGLACVGDVSGTERCNGSDDDCDGQTDEPDAEGCATYYADRDGDGWGTGADARCLCRAQSPYLASSDTDCDDADPLRNPGQPEACDGFDNDCDGATDDLVSACATGCGEGTRECIAGEWQPCSALSPLLCFDYGSCNRTPLCVTECPGAPPEACNGRDDDCDGWTDEDFDCMPGQTTSEPCGLCGTRTTVCTAACTWGTAGSCTGEGVCSPGQSETTNCGNCGHASRTCQANCQWGATGSCTGQGVCAPGTTTQTGCDVCAQKTCSTSCQWSACALLPGKTCLYEDGTNWECCGYGRWHFCLPPRYGEAGCRWSPDCVDVPNHCR